MRTAFRCQRHAGRRADDHEARILVAGVVERIEAAGDERIIHGPDWRRRLPNSECDRPAAPSSRNRFISAIPSSMCWPFGVDSHFAVEGMFSAMNVSACSVRAKSLRRLPKGRDWSCR